MRTAIAAGLAALLTGSAALAQAPSAAQRDLIDHVRTVDDLAAVCDPSWGGVSRLEAIAYCQGYLTSAGQYHALMHPRGGRFAPVYCVPTPGPSIAESGIGFAAWARENRQLANEPALDGFLRWAQARFPCPATTSPSRRSR